MPIRAGKLPPDFAAQASLRQEHAQFLCDLRATGRLLMAGTFAENVPYRCGDARAVIISQPANPPQPNDSTDSCGGSILRRTRRI
jgi:hypothetical protein